MTNIVWLRIFLGLSIMVHASVPLFEKGDHNDTDYDYDKAFDGVDDELIIEEDVCGSCECSNLTEASISVDCSGRSLSALPVWISSLTIILKNHTHMDLDLSSNGLGHIQQLPPLPLWSIDLSRNNIKTADPAAFSNVGSTLLSLDLSHNEIAGDSINSTTFIMKHNKTDRTASPPALLSLSLADNHIHWLEATAFIHLINLQTLDLSDNPLGDITNNTSQAITAVVTLQTLNLRNVGLQHLPDHFFFGLNQLASLDLSGNRLKVVPPQLQAASSISSLQLDNNDFLSLEANSFLGLNNLQNLSISNNFALHLINSGAFSPLVSLEQLRVQDNPALAWISPGTWEERDPQHNFKLKELLISNNKLKYLPTQFLPDFSNWKDLDVTDIQGNPWWCDCHNDWIINTLVPMIHDKTPELTPLITCAGPPDFFLVKEELMVVHEMTPAQDLPCNHQKFDPWKTNYGVPSGHLKWLEASKARETSGSLPTALVVICVLSVSATAALVGVLYQRQRKARPAGSVRFSRGGPKTAGARVTRYSRPGAKGTGIENTEFRDEESLDETTKQMRTVRQWPPEQDKVPDLQL